MRRHPAATVAAVVAMTCVFFILGIFLDISYNVGRLVDRLEARKGLVVFLDPEMSESRREELKGIFEGFEEVASIRFVSREEALRELERDLGGTDVEGILGENPLPDALEITCWPEARDAATLASLATEMQAYDGVEDVLYGKRWVEVLDRGLRTLRRLTLLVGLLAAAAVSLVLAATLRLGLLHRRQALGIMTVIGATRGFIRGPFLLAGVLQVLLAMALALFLLWISVAAGNALLPGILYLPAGWIVLLILAGGLVGLGASYVSLEPVLRGLERPSRRMAALAVALACLLLVPAVAQQSLEDYQRELQQLKEEIQANRQRIGELEDRRENLQEMLQRLRRDLELSREYVTKLEAQEKRLLADLERRREELGGIRDRVASLREAIRRRLRNYYMKHRLDVAELLLSSKSFPQLFARAHYVGWLLERDREDLARLRAQEDSLEEARRRLEARKAEIARLRAEAVRERRRLERQEARTREEEKRVKEELARHRQRLKELEEREARTVEVLRRLEAERQRGGFPGEGLKGMRGKLPWPVRGRVVTRFGYQVHPRFRTRIMNRGVDIAAPKGEIFRAVAPGRVVYADWLSGYGNCVILDHGAGFYTLYAHAQELLVTKGQQVAAGDPLGKVGDTDSVRGPVLHFQIRKGAEAQDPEAWLRRR
jgi:septal ring factor EnvC (AmiA/AmiB activator)/cell division protein FtsX